MLRPGDITRDYSAIVLDEWGTQRCLELLSISHPAYIYTSVGIHVIVRLRVAAQAEHADGAV